MALVHYRNAKESFSGLPCIGCLLPRQWVSRVKEAYRQDRSRYPTNRNQNILWFKFSLLPKKAYTLFLFNLHNFSNHSYVFYIIPPPRDHRGGAFIQREPNAYKRRVLQSFRSSKI